MKETIEETVAAQEEFAAKMSWNPPKNMRAWTKEKNTELTDLQEHVVHIVEYEVGGNTKRMEILAACPMDAIDHAHEYLTNRD